MEEMVGKTVEIRDDLDIGTDYENVDFSKGMGKYKGMSAKIVRVIVGANGNRYFRLDIDDEKYYWTREMFVGFGDIYSKEVEDLINHVSRLYPQQLIDYALKERDKDLFYKLTSGEQEEQEVS